MMVVEPLHHHISKKPFCSITIIFFKKSNIIQRAMVENFPLRQQNHHHQAILLTHCKMKMKWKSSQEHTFSLIKRLRDRERERKRICKRNELFFHPAMHSALKNYKIVQSQNFIYGSVALLSHFHKVLALSRFPL